MAGDDVTDVIQIYKAKKQADRSINHVRFQLITGRFRLYLFIAIRFDKGK